jgi:LPXTG-motif cell wall anchor domain protein
VKATPAPQSPAAPKAQLPHTGTEASLALTLAGLAVAGIATTMVRKKKEQ